ncbi:MAG: 2-oxoacid:acceptor oxidoreductase family protein, partial [Thermoproteota archaeon]
KLGLNVKTLGVVDAARISKEVFGTYVFNTPVLGGLVRLTSIVRLETLEKLFLNRFPGRVGELNVKMLKRGYEEVASQ